MFTPDAINAMNRYNEMLADAQPRRELMRNHPLFLRPLGIREAVENFFVTLANSFSPKHKSAMNR